MPVNRSIFTIWCFSALLFPASIAMAQVIPGCDQIELPNPPRLAYECRNGLVFEAEISAEFQSSGPVNQAGPNEINLNGAAILIDLPPEHGDFQVRTPFAIASVRGTEFIVDTQEARTSVFVREGTVVVTLNDGSDSVELNPDEGVDVAPGNDLVVRVWSEERITQLLRRFAR